MEIKELDVVRLKDGRRGTVVGFYKNDSVLLLDMCSDDGKSTETPFVHRTEVDEVEYKHIN